jgi:hypothetical protein
MVMTTFTTEDRIIVEKDGSLTFNCDWYQKQYYQLLEQHKKLEEECNALRKQLMVACNELMEIKR